MDLFERLTDYAWAAGIIDGEGSIGCFGGRPTGNPPKPKWAIKVSASNTDPRMVLRLKDIFGYGVIPAKRPGTGSSRPTYEWTVASRQAVAVLQVIQPFLVLKKEQAEIALAIAATMHRKGQPATWTGTNRWSNGMRKRLRPEVVAERERLAARLKVLKHEARTIEEVG